MTAPTGREVQFRRLFAEEAGQRLARLSRQLLELEEGGDDDELVASIFRDAHTIKGSAAVVGADDMGRVAHAMEDLLEQLRSGQRRPDADFVDVLLAATDAMVLMLPALLNGEDRSEQAASIEDRLHAVARAPVPPTAPMSPSEVPVGPSPAVAPSVSPSLSQPASPSSDLTSDASGLALPPSSGTAVMAPPGPLGLSATGRSSPALFEEPTARPTASRRPTDTGTTSMLVPIERLDELVRLVGESAAAQLRLGLMLSERLEVDPGTVAEFRDLSRVLNDLQERTMRARMIPLATITDSLRRAVRDAAHTLGKTVRWEVRGGETELDRSVLQELGDPLLHLVRNAVDHGLEDDADRRAMGKPVPATVRLQAMQLGSEVIISIRDDGRGIDLDRVRVQAVERGLDVSDLSDDDTLQLIFRSGLSTATVVTDLSGRGVGLDAVRASVSAVRGRIEVHSEWGVGTELRIIVPITLAVLPCLMVGIGDERYAVPMHSVAVALASETAVFARAEGRRMVWVGDVPVATSSLAQTLWGVERPVTGEVVLVVGTTRRHAFMVDRLLGQRDVVVKGLSRLLPRLDVFVGASVEPDGSILLVLDVAGLVERAQTVTPTIGAREPAAGFDDHQEHATTILVVDDAVVVRQLERSILERAGYRVVTASDGVEALSTLASTRCDIVLADVEMPRMDGIALTRGIRADSRFTNLPVLIITSQAGSESRQRALDAGADGFIVKSAFDETDLLVAVSRLIGNGS